MNDAAVPLDAFNYDPWGTPEAGALGMGTDCSTALQPGKDYIGMQLEILDYGQRALAHGVLVQQGTCREIAPATEFADGGWFIRA